MLNSVPAAVPLDPDRLLRGCEGATGVLVAVSGGPDSMALLLLAAAWAAKPGRPPVFSATVDHGLRAGSSQEAHDVGTHSKALGVPHYTLGWRERPTTRIQERAREGRYALLDSCARRLGASILVTAHHADDQSETVLFRLARGSGVAGLGGMAEKLRRGPLILFRPFLDIKKAALVAFCEERGQSYATDPSNLNPRFARGRLRLEAPALDRLGLTVNSLCRLAKRAARAEAALKAAYAGFLDDAAIERAPGRTLLRRPSLAAAPAEMLVRLCSEEAARVADRPPPRLERAETLAERLLIALAQDGRLRASLGGAVFDLSDERLEIRKECRTSVRPAGAVRTALEDGGTTSLVKGSRGA